MGFWAHIRLESCPCRLIIPGMQFCKRMVPRKMTPESSFPRRRSEERRYQIAGASRLTGFVGNMSPRILTPIAPWRSLKFEKTEMAFLTIAKPDGGGLSGGQRRLHG